MSADTPDHVRGPSRARKHARLETKMGAIRREYRDADGRPQATHDSGGGYERIRTSERVASDPRERAVDVQFYHHRLLAIAWNIDYEDTGESILPEGYEGLVDPAILEGDDVHHRAPEAAFERSIPWDNREACLVAIDHATHAGLTNAEERAYAEDAKRVRDGQVTLEAGCDGCGAEDPEWTIAESDAEYCLDCATEHADGRTIEAL